MTVYYEAAKRVANGENDLACIAIGDIVGDFRHIYVSRFERYFKPEKNSSLFWWDRDYRNPQCKGRLARSLALLLMHEMEQK